MPLVPLSWKHNPGPVRVKASRENRSVHRLPRLCWWWDDEATLRGCCRFGLEPTGYRVLCAGRWRSLTLFHRESRILVVLDVCSPKADGYRYCRASAGLKSCVPINLLIGARCDHERVSGSISEPTTTSPTTVQPRASKHGFSNDSCAGRAGLGHDSSPATFRVRASCGVAI